MRGQFFTVQNAVYAILIRDARGRLASIAAQYPGLKVTLWNRKTRDIVAETDGY